MLLGTGLVVSWAQARQGGPAYVPEYLWQKGIADKTTPKGIADTYVGIRYRGDGTIDEKGYFTTFNRPDKLFERPGLNCSGLVVSVARFLFEKNFTLAQAKRDRSGNSGPGSPLGEDWDFGWDLIFNLTDGLPRRVISPDGSHSGLDGSDGVSLRGFDLKDERAWKKVLAQMRPGHVYLGSISKRLSRRNNHVLHYHVVLIIPDQEGGIWLYHATRRSNVHKMNLATRRGLGRLMAQFGRGRSSPKRILLVEARLPGVNEAVASGSSGTAQSVSHDVAHGNRQSSPEADIARKALALVEGVVPGTAEINRDAHAQQAARVVANPAGAESASTGSSSDTQPTPPAEQAPNLVIKHKAGTVFQSIPSLVTHIPRFGDESAKSLNFWFRNRGEQPRRITVILRTPGGDLEYEGTIPPGGSSLNVVYPRDFGKKSAETLATGNYGEYVKVDGKDWVTNLFEVTEPREAEPKIVQVRAPSQVRSGQSFTVQVKAQNQGAESDYGGITVSSPDPSGLRIAGAKPGKVYGRGSEVLSITQDKIRTKVPMAERWIELWPEDEVYELKVRIKAGKPGRHELFIRCALRGVNVRSSVIRMDPKTAKVADQQGFPVYVHEVQVHD